jgi:hypothetical protein
MRSSYAADSPHLADGLLYRMQNENPLKTSGSSSGCRRIIVAGQIHPPVIEGLLPRRDTTEQPRASALGSFPRGNRPGRGDTNGCHAFAQR